MTAAANEIETRTPPRTERVVAICAELDRWGSYEDRGFVISVSATSPEVWVRQAESGGIVAYSSTEADRKASIEEFASDYFS